MHGPRSKILMLVTDLFFKYDSFMAMYPSHLLVWPQFQYSFARTTSARCRRAGRAGNRRQVVGSPPSQTWRRFHNLLEGNEKPAWNTEKIAVIQNVERAKVYHRQCSFEVEWLISANRGLYIGFTVPRGSIWRWQERPAPGYRPVGTPEIPQGQLRWGQEPIGLHVVLLSPAAAAGCTYLNLERVQEQRQLFAAAPILMQKKRQTS